MATVTAALVSRRESPAYCSITGKTNKGSIYGRVQYKTLIQTAGNFRNQFLHTRCSPQFGRRRPVHKAV